MRRISLRERKNSPHASVLRVEGLEDRQLLSTASLSDPSDIYAVPQAIVRPLNPAEVALIPSGYTTDIPSMTPLGGTGPATSAPYTPAQIRQAYGINQLSESGAGQTIAIVDAYDLSSSFITSDLTTFDTQFGLPAPPSFTVSTPTSPEANSGWDWEIALDVEWAHAIAPAANILLVETATASFTSLLAGVSYAVSQGANQVSMSWGGSEFGGESSYSTTYFDHPGVTFLASSGDVGGELSFPAASPYVTSVGGSSLSIDASGNYISESAWAGSGGGISTQISEPSYQTGFLTSSQDPTGDRGVPDVAYDADPNTGVNVYKGAWSDVGGTSIGSPQWAGLVALANQGRVAAGESTLGTGQTNGTNSVIYQLAGGTSYTNPNGDYNDVTTGSNGNPAKVGYDLVTGLGSPVANKLIPDLITPPGSTAPQGNVATFSGSDTTTQGNWSPTYGSAGYEVIGGQTSLPSYATVTATTGQPSWTWAQSTTDFRAPQVAPGATDRVAATWYGSTFTVGVDLTDGQAHQVSLYLLDWDSTSRSERIDVLDGTTGSVLSTQTASSFNGGEYLTWTVTGNVQFRITQLGGVNAVLSGLFFGSPPQGNGNAATFSGSDTTTQGNWSPTYGSAGYEVIGGQTSLPSYATVTATTGQPSWTWAQSTTDFRAPQVAPGATDRVAATWYGSTFTVGVDLTDGQAHQVSLYLLDWDSTSRSERIDVLDGTTGSVLSTQTASSFNGGEYLTWTVTGNVQFRITQLGGVNAVLSGLFFGSPPQGNGNAATFSGSDTTTQGNWSPTYGSAGYEVIGGQTSLPSYATVTAAAGQPTWTWTQSTTDVRAPQVAPGATDRVAATWYGSTFAVDVDLTDGQAHQVSLYLLDWDSTSRSERIDVLDGTTGSVLSTQTASSFNGGEYLTWTVTGNVQFRITQLGGANAVLSGLFFG